MDKRCLLSKSASLAWKRWRVNLGLLGWCASHSNSKQDTATIPKTVTNGWTIRIWIPSSSGFAKNGRLIKRKNRQNGASTHGCAVRFWLYSFKVGKNQQTFVFFVFGYLRSRQIRVDWHLIPRATFERPPCPLRVFCTPPHCLKKNGTLASRH